MDSNSGPAMDGIVREARVALRWLHQHLATLGGDPARVYVSGRSAGGHLAAVLMDDALVAGGLANSGLFDLEPIRLCYLNEKLGLDAEQARRNSPCCVCRRVRPNLSLPMYAELRGARPHVPLAAGSHTRWL